MKKFILYLIVIIIFSTIFGCIKQPSQYNTRNQKIEPYLYTGKVTDKFDGMTRYSFRIENDPYARIKFEAYILVNKNGKKTIYSSLRYSSTSWLFIDKVSVKFDNDNPIILPINRDISRDVGYGGWVYESADYWDCLDLLKKIDSSNTVVFRISGSKGSIDHTLLDMEKTGVKYLLEEIEKIKP